MDEEMTQFWGVPAAELLADLHSSAAGLTGTVAQQRLESGGRHLRKISRRAGDLTLLLAQFKSPIILLLLAAAGLSFSLKDVADAAIILIIVLVSGTLGFWQERGAANAVQKLLAIVRIKLTILRD